MTTECGHVTGVYGPRIRHVYHAGNRMGKTVNGAIALNRRAIALHVAPGVTLKDAARVVLDAYPCRCGLPVLVRHEDDGKETRVIAYCEKRAWFNFWLHDPPRYIYQYPKGA